MPVKYQSIRTKSKDYSQYPFMNFSLKNMKGEEWIDMKQFDGCYSISNYGRIWAYARPVNSITGQLYYTKERFRKQCLTRYYNSYSKDYTDQLSIHLRYEGKSFSFKVNRLVYHFFVKPLDLQNERLVVVHKDGDNCNNRYDNLVLMNGTQLYAHNLNTQRIPRAGRTIKKGKRITWSDKNSPRPVIKYSLDGKKIKEYASVGHAALENNTNRGNIRAVALKKLIQSNGFVYRFKGTAYKGEHADFSYEKIVMQFDLNGKKLKTYPSVKEAGIQTGLDANTISKCALRKSRICGGYVWRYQGDTYMGEYKDKIKNKAKPVIQYSLEGKRMAYFSSVNEAAKATGFSAATLLDCAYKRARVSHGFVWRFENESYKGEYKHYSIGKPVTQYTLEGGKISIYHSIEAAAKATGLTSDNIQKNVKGENKTAGGFVWKSATPQEIRKLPEFKPAKNTGGAYEKKEVIQYSLEGKKLAVHASISEAAKACGLSGTGISSVLNKPNRSAAGYVWRTKGNPYRGSFAKTPPANKARLVTQYDLKGLKLHVYKSTRQAESATGVSASTISFVARGKLKTTGGFIWQYGNGPKRLNVKEHHASTFEHIKSISKPVIKYSLEGKFIQEYPSIKAASREEGIAINRISSVINGQSKSAGGNLWKTKVKIYTKDHTEK